MPASLRRNSPLETEMRYHTDNYFGRRPDVIYAGKNDPGIDRVNINHGGKVKVFYFGITMAPQKSGGVIF